MSKLFNLRRRVTTAFRILEAEIYSISSWLEQSRTQSSSFKKKGLDLSGGGLQRKFAFDRNLEIAIQYFSELLSLMKATVNDPLEQTTR